MLSSVLMTNLGYSLFLVSFIEKEPLFLLLPLPIFIARRDKSKGRLNPIHNVCLE